jgi:4-hydroxybenzoate polyprenyltransferase
VKIAMVILCMILARTWAMLVNRLADREFDSANPRTARRIIASGALAQRDATLIAAGSGCLFVVSASAFYFLFGNPWPVLLAVPVLGWIALYSFTKRFTAACHVFLGGALAASPIAAAIAVDPHSLAITHSILWLSAMVVCWVAGFDVIYALQDIDFDCASGLHSIPARLGPARAIWVSRFFHAAAGACALAAANSDDRFGTLFRVGVLLVLALLVSEHAVLSVRGKAGLDMAFFTINGVVSCVLGAAGVLDLTLF